MAASKKQKFPDRFDISSVTTYTFHTVLILLSVLLSLNFVSSEECNVNGFSLSQLQKFDHWEATSTDGNISYTINLCGHVKSECHDGTSVCMTKGGKSYSIGNVTTPHNLTSGNNDKLAEMWIILQGDQCPDDKKENLTSVINMKCGKTLGSPQFLDYAACTTYFEWITSAVCKNMKVPETEVPCYVIDDQNEKYDLNALIKLKGGYLADSTEGWDFYINVCRDITADSGTAHCPTGAAACKVKDGTVINMGKPSERLKRLQNGYLRLTYTTAEKPDGCTQKPNTTIDFICPKAGDSGDPLLVTDRNCHYYVQWKTERACREQTITSKTCKLHNEERDIDIDLTPLTKAPGENHPYSVYHRYKHLEQPYRYFINICGELGIQCPDDSHVKGVAACQTQIGNSSFGMVMGKVEHQKLSYADGELKLIYTGGDVCNNTKFQRQTVIVFNCFKDAGKGSPQFDRESECTYFFQWNTSYACLDHPVVQECRINYNGKRFDLSPLVRRTGNNWEVLQSEGDRSQSQYYINICNDVLLEGKASSCPPDSSVCLIDKDGMAHNLGKYAGNPLVDPVTKAIQINYTNGDSCSTRSNKRKYSVITFICKPGDLESGLVLLQKSLDDCVYEFEWQTAAACVLAKKTGSNCRLLDDDLGFDFDLTKLKKTDGTYYTARTTQYDYRINICGEVSAKPCGTGQHPGVCQVKHAENRTYNIGQFSEELQYFDGMIKLIYKNGDPYGTGVPRTTEIALLCDRDIGVGQPVFIGESANTSTYSFLWNTSYACPSQPVECIATDPVTNKQYDLSSLTRVGKQDNWAIEDTKNKLKYYINVCRSLNGVSFSNGARSCSTFASVCRTRIADGNETVDFLHTNMGKVQGGPVIEDVGRLVLTYNSTEPCAGPHGTTNMITKLRFVCTRGVLTRGPAVPTKINECEYVFEWQTEAACPIEEVISKDHEACTVRDPNSNYVFNLRSLSKNGNLDYYTVISTGHTYRLKICGSLSQDICGTIEGIESSMCEVLSNGSKPGLAFASQMLDFSDDGKLQLTYDGKRLASGQRVQVKIVFLCRKNLDTGKPVLSRVIENSYDFTFETPLACKPEPVDCLVQDDKGSQYDLSPLARTFINWMVLDTRGTGWDHTYYINVCRPVAAINGSTCPGGPVGGCQITKDGRSFNMGYIQSKPIARDDGTLTLRYRNGDLCHKGTSRQSHRSTRINFYCSPTEHNPTFETETETCEYVFNWQTRAACPVQQVVGTDCRVTDPLYNQQFDFHDLRKSPGDYHIRFGEYEYLLNLCGPLNSKCNGMDNSAVCQTKPKSPTYQVNAGLSSSSKLIYDSGEITLIYSDGKGSCHKNFTRSTIITFFCDQSKDGKAGPKFINESADCTYMFEWQTKMACPPFKIGDCSVIAQNGQEFDLSSLSMTNDNYDYIQLYAKKKYIINVCRSLVHLKDETCPPNSAACMVDLGQTNNTSKFHSIGEVNENQVLYKDGRLQLYYNNGDVCPTNKTLRMSTRIILYCNKDAIDTHPTGHFTVGCEHRFIWYTRAACPLDKTDQSGSGNCTVKNPRTGHEFDLSSLSNDEGYELSDHKGHKFKINICNPIKGSKCTSTKTGACQEEQIGEGRSFNSGDANKKLQYDDGVLFLNYTGGDTCHQHFKRNVIINFVCSESAGKGKPVYIDETDDCTYYISWHTSLACDEKIKCSVDVDSHTVDLSPLIKREGFHLAISTMSNDKRNSNSTFYLNVCEPLNPIYATICPAGSSACMLQLGHKPVGLGRLHRPPYVDKSSSKIVLVYDHGDPVPTDPTKNISTKIIFTCKPGPSQGTPYLEQITSDYEYVFSWETNAVCIEKTTQTSDCVFVDSQTGIKYNMTSLNTGIPYKVHSPTQNVDYLISVCENLKSPPNGCTGAGICRVAPSSSTAANMGKATDVSFRKNGDVFRMTYNKGSACMDKNYNKGEIEFMCDPDEDLGRPLLLSDSWCDVRLIWKTRLTCAPVSDQCSLAHGGHTYDLSMLSSQTSSWNVTDKDGNRYWINVCQGIHKGPGSSCPNIAGACLKTKTGQIDNLGVVTTQKLHVDDHGSIILEYTHGDSACASKHRRSNNPAAKTMIRFECGSTVGGPVYDSEKSDSNTCVFAFYWKSRIACMIKREKLKEENGTLYDPETDRVIGLNQIKGTYMIQGDEKYYYSLSLEGKANGCGGNTVVCKQRDRKYNSIGSLHNTEYYLEDGILEGEYKSSEQCDKDTSKYKKTIIQFYCNKTEGIPVFFSESRDCVYVFTWGTPVMCMTPNVIQQTVISGGVSVAGTGNGTKGKAHTVAAIVGVFSAAIFICILLIVFHKKDRRAAFVSRIKRIVSRSDNTLSFNYSSLPQSSDNEEDENDEIMICTDAADTQTETTPINVPVKSYHDDSDDDLLS